MPAEPMTPVERKPIPGFPGYFATSGGDILSFKYRRWKQLVPNHAQKGYAVVSVRDSDGRKSTQRVHRLVLLAFVGPCPDGYQTRHLNGDRKDNRLANICWGTPVENHDDMRRHGTLPGWQNKGSNHGNAKLTEDQARQIKLALNKSYREAVDLAVSFGVSVFVVRRIMEGKAWTHVTI